MVPISEVAEVFQLAPDFVELVARWDPGGRFRNDYLDRYLTAPAATA